MSSALDNLTMKLGPLPVWVWGIGGAGALRGFSWYRNRNNAPADITEDSAATEPPPGSLVTPSRSAGGAGLAGYGGAYPTYAGTDTPVNPGASASPLSPVLAPYQPVAITDNDSWRNSAIEAVIARGVLAAAAVEAIGRYLSGEPINPQQDAVIALALRLAGPPPQPVPPINRTSSSIYVAPPAVVAPAPAPPAAPPSTPAAPNGTYTIKAGDNLYIIARARYGNTALATINGIARVNNLTWNAAHTQVTPFRPGQVLVLPNTL